MKRNSKHEQQRKLDRLNDRKNEMFMPEGWKHMSRRQRWQDNMIWVPVEEPRFLGWDITLTISEAGQRRSDAHIMFNVIKLLKVNESRYKFTKDTEVIKFIRKAGKRLNTFLTLWSQNERMKRRHMTIRDWYRYHPHCIPSLGDAFITPEQWSKLDERTRAYFSLYEKFHPATWARESYTEDRYRIGGRFPMHELRLHIEQVYSTHRGIPRSEEISEEKKIDNHLWSLNYYNKRWGKDGYVKHENYFIKRSLRRAWKSMTQQVSRKSDPEVIDDQEGRKIKFKQHY